MKGENEIMKIEPNENIWKPCPFCGSEKIKFDKCTLRVKCANCFATSGFISKYVSQGISEQDAAKMVWNNRFVGLGEVNDGV